MLRGRIRFALDSLYHVEARSGKCARNDLGLMKTKIEAHRLLEQLFPVHDLITHVKAGNEQSTRSHDAPALRKNVRKLGRLEVNYRIKKHDTRELVILEFKRTHIASDEFDIVYTLSRCRDHRGRNVDTDHCHACIVQIFRNVTRTAA
jgi:hypothetical protein